MIDGMLLALLLVTAGLLVSFHLRYAALLRASKDAPLLSGRMNNAMKDVKSALQDLRELAQTHDAQLGKKLNEAQKVLLEFDYVLDRAEKVLKKMDVSFAGGAAQPQPIRDVPTQARLETPKPQIRPQQNTRPATPAAPAPFVPPRVQTAPLGRPTVRASAGAGGNAYAQTQQSAQPGFISDAEEDLRRVLRERL